MPRTRGRALVHRTRRSGLRVGRGDGPRHRRAAGHADATAESYPDLARVTVTARACSPGQRLRLVKFVAYGWSAARSLPARARPGRRGAGRRQARPAGTACWPSSARYLDDFWDRADVEVDGDAEIQQAVRFALFHVLQAGRPGRGPGDPGQGPDRARLRRPHASGTPRPSCCRCSPTPRPTRPRTPCAGGTPPCRWPRSARAQLGPARRGVPVAHHPRRGVLRLLAGRHGRVPHQRRHRRRGHPLRRRHRRRRVRAGRRAGAAGRDRPAVALARAPRRRRAGSASTASPAPTSTARIADNNVYTNLMAQQNLRAAADAASRHPERARELGVDERGDGGLARRRRRDVHPLRRARSGVHPQAEGFTRHQVWDFAAHHARAVPAAAALPLLRPLPQAGRQAGRPGAGHAPARRRLHRRAEGRATSPTTSGSPCGTPRCPRAPRR